MLRRKAIRFTAANLASLDLHIRNGEAGKARKELRGLRRARIEPALIEPLAVLCRRAGLADDAVHLLSRVNASGKAVPDSQRIEYATCLALIGAPEEAFQLLKKLEAPTAPRALFAAVSTLVPQWDYAGTIPLLKLFLEKEQDDRYMRIVADVNLAAAYVATSDYERAGHELERIKALTRENNLLLLHGYSLQLAAQCAILQGAWKNGEALLKESAQFFDHTAESIQTLTLEKWRTFLILLRDGFSKAARDRLEWVRAKALRLQHWETLRECDRYQAQAQNNLALATHLYHGTRWPKYRERIQAKFKIESHYDWLPRGEAKKTFDLSTGDYNGRLTDLKLGQLPHLILKAGCSDFYRPFRLATFHYLVFPERPFHPVHSANCLHRALSRFRDWKIKHRMPFDIVFENGHYRLTLSQPVAIKVSAAAQETRQDSLLESLKAKLPPGEFKLQHVTRALGLSDSGARRLLQQAAGQNIVEKTAGGKSTRYRFKP